MKPVDDSPLDHLLVEHERSSFLNGSDDGPEDLEDLPPPPMIVSEDDPYFDYPDDNRMPTPPPSPGVSPFNPPRSTTPVNGKALCPAGRERVFVMKHFEPYESATATPTYVPN